MDRTRSRRLRRWHRQIGVALTAFIILVAATGILLNHTEDLRLDEHPAPSAIAGWYYEGDLAGVSGYALPSGFLFLAGTDVYLDGQVVTSCFDGLRGGASMGVAGSGMGRMTVALCGPELLLVDANGLLVERLAPVHGIPTGIRAVGVDGEYLLVRLADRTVRFDPFTLTATASAAAGEWPEPVPVPASMTQALLVDVVSWEKVILDLHTGRVLGVGGVWVADFVALFLVVMAITGLVMARRPRRPGRHRRPRRDR